MATRTPAAGGFFLIVAILAGTAWGVSVGQEMKGILLGTLAGIVIALAVWLIDRRRNPNR
ncbi:MAG: hypothetical protein ABIR51_07310 [Sphingomicrobium sp.]